MSAHSRRLCAVSVGLLLAAACGGKDSPEPASQADAVAAESDASAAPDDSAEMIGTTLFFDDEALPTADALKKYEAECSGKATAECKRLQWQLEFALYVDMRELARRNALDDELVRVGAAADSPQLKALSLDRMLGRGLQPEEQALVVAAFDDPYPRVRAVAQLLARQLPDEKWVRMTARDSGVRNDGLSGLIAGATLDEKRLGARFYPGAEHWYFASSPTYGEFFTTSDEPQKVIDFYAGDDGEALSGEELTAKIEAAKSATQNPMLVAQKMQEALEAGEDPQKVMASLSAGAMVAAVDWTEGIDGSEGMIAPRYVVLAEEESLGQRVPARVVAVFRDDLMGATGVIIRNKPRARTGPDLSTPEAIEAYTRVQAILSSPEARVD
jgi:hypothetical protein